MINKTNNILLLFVKFTKDSFLKGINKLKMKSEFTNLTEKENVEFFVD